MASHPVNLYAGWVLILLAFISGALVGLGFHKPGFLGGYDPPRRRTPRLGHIALAALGMFHLPSPLTPFPPPGSAAAIVAGAGLVVGGATMSLVCFLTAWREPFRHLFFIPVVSLVSAVVAILVGGALS